MLERPANRALAEQFYQERQQRSVRLHRDAAVRFYAAAAYKTCFWLRRAPPETNREDADNSTLSVELMPRTILRLNPRAQFREAPIVEGAFITSATAVVVPQMREPLVFIYEVKVSPLILMLDRPMRCDQILACWASYIGSSTALGILRVAFGNCLLVP
jgi:hypothetical protein